MRGISSIIVVVLILMIVVALAGLTYMFSSAIFTSTTATTKQSITKTTAGLLANMKIESVSGNKVYVRNVGQTDLSNFSVYIGDAPVEYEIDKPLLSPGDMAAIRIKKIYNVTSGIWEVPSGDMRVTTSEGPLGEYKNYQGYSGDLPLEILNQQSFVSFTYPVNGYSAIATVYDGDGLADIQPYCYIQYWRENDRAGLGYQYKDSSSYPEDVVYDPTNGNCKANITTFDAQNVYWSNYTTYSFNQHSLILDGDYVFTGDSALNVAKWLIGDGSLVSIQDEGSGVTLRGMSNDSEFIYFGDNSYNLTKVRKSDLQRNLTFKYPATTGTIYSTAVDDTGLYFGTSSYNITKVNKTNFAQRFWSVDYGSYVVNDIEVDADYLYAVDNAGNITKLNKTSVGTGQKIWSIRPSQPSIVPKYALALEGNNLWVVGGGSVLWQIDKTSGAILNYTDYTNIFYSGSSVSMYEITYDNDFIYFSDSWSWINRVNKTSKEIETVFYAPGIGYGLACDANYCYSSTTSYVVKFSKIPLYDIYGNLYPGNNYTSSERITSFIYFYDLYWNGAQTTEATNAIP